MIRIIAIGKKHEQWIEPGLERYQKRLRRPFNAEWTLLPHSALDGTSARNEESERIASRLTADDYVILLDERGDQMTCEEFSRQLERQFTGSSPLVIIIGGAYGVDELISNRANLTLSLSSMVFPHQLVRLLIIEQLYRAQEIAAGGKYHHA